MRVSYLELKNYRKFKELRLQFPDGIVGILGLNASGKSTVIEGIAWALFGNVDEVVRTSREGIRRDGAGPSESCSAVLEFELGGAEYKIEREMGGKSLTMRAELKTKDKSIAQGDKPVREMVQKLIGMDHKSFFTSVFARQKELNALQNVAAGERKKVVLRMLRIDGIDSVLASVRADKKDKQSRIEGAQKTLLTDDGREREKVLGDKLPELERAHDSAVQQLESAEKREHYVAKEFEEAKKRRDELKKDVDAYNAAVSDLKGKQSQVKEMKARESGIASRLDQANQKLSKMPELEKEEQAWKDVGARKEHLEGDRTKHERAKMLSQEISAEEKELGRRSEEILKLKAEASKPEEVLAKIEDTEKAKVDCQTARSDAASRIGVLKAKASEKREAASKDRKKLEEIRSAGKEGICPTCERALEEAYELLVKKLGESSADAEKAATEAEAEISRLVAESNSLASREEALKKRKSSLDKDLARLRQLETTLESKESELAGVSSRTNARKKMLKDLGDISFSEEEYAVVSKEYERLKRAHDEYVGLTSLKVQAGHYSKDLEDVREQVKKSINEEQQFKGIVDTLEPKKSLFESAIKGLDEKTAALGSAKDEARKTGLMKERAHAELDRTRRDIEEITRVKKNIEGDRKLVDDLALLEDVMVNFKDHLIAKVRPALSALTSKSLESMTDGRYSRVELDENYEIMVDDQGTMYPLSRFSGGESDLANLSLRLAISGIIADRTGATPMNLLILDEIFGSQDPHRKRSVMAALSKLSVQFRQIFLITHIEDIKDSLNYVIRVEEQEDGTSKASLAG